MRRAAALALVLAGCGSSEPDPELLDQPAPMLPGGRGAAIELLQSRELDELMQLEDARSLGGGRLFELLRDEHWQVRARAATALGRFPFPRFGAEVTGALARALEDPELEVRLAAAFALGIRGDPAGAGTLLAYRNDPEARMRAYAVEAASRLDAPAAHGQILLSLRDADLGVRVEAAVGTARWSTTAANAGEVDRALLDALHPYRITPESAHKSAVEAELVWRILWALGRRKAELGRGAFLEYASSENALERLFALRGLAQIKPDPAGLNAAIAALKGPTATGDWRVAYEATVLLGRFGPELANVTEEERDSARESVSPVFEALETAAEHPSLHVRAGAMSALGSYKDGETVLALLQRGRLDLSASVRAAALKTRARIASPADALDILGHGARGDDPVLRLAAADAAGALQDERAVPILFRLTRDPSLLVATRAVEKLGRHLTSAREAELRSELHGFLAHADTGMRLSAVMALREQPDLSDVGPLARAFKTTRGDGASEVAFSVLQNLGKIGGEEAQRFLEKALSDPRPYVRVVARKVLSEGFGVTPPEEPPGLDVASEHTVPLAGKDYPLWRFNPMVEVATSRGSMVFELFPAEAPLHVYNFLRLVDTKAYDELSFHRVEPDFVIQGGDYRGDGNGAKPFVGEALRAEFTPRRYTRGSLGMPRNEDPDSGGSQFFVTHVPTPHLDGRYTIFGELRTGGDVLDQIEVGDRILSARILR